MIISHVYHRVLLLSLVVLLGLTLFAVALGSFHSAAHAQTSRAIEHSVALLKSTSHPAAAKTADDNCNAVPSWDIHSGHFTVNDVKLYFTTQYMMGS